MIFISAIIFDSSIILCRVKLGYKELDSISVKAYGIFVEELPVHYAKRTLLNEAILPEVIAKIYFADVDGVLNKSIDR